MFLDDRVEPAQCRSNPSAHEEKLGLQFSSFFVEFLESHDFGAGPVFEGEFGVRLSTPRTERFSA
jgi:hypothetical protein